MVSRRRLEHRRRRRATPQTDDALQPTEQPQLREFADEPRQSSASAFAAPPAVDAWPLSPLRTPSTTTPTPSGSSRSSSRRCSSTTTSSRCSGTKSISRCATRGLRRARPRHARTAHLHSSFPSQVLEQLAELQLPASPRTSAASRSRCPSPPPGGSSASSSTPARDGVSRWDLILCHHPASLFLAALALSRSASPTPSSRPPRWAPPSTCCARAVGPPLMRTPRRRRHRLHVVDRLGRVVAVEERHDRDEDRRTPRAPPAASCRARRGRRRCAMPSSWHTTTACRRPRPPSRPRRPPRPSRSTASSISRAAAALAQCSPRYPSRCTRRASSAPPTARASAPAAASSFETFMPLLLPMCAIRRKPPRATPCRAGRKMPGAPPPPTRRCRSGRRRRRRRSATR